MTFQKEHVQDMYLLSPMQEGMLFHFLEDGKPDTYLVQIVTAVYGELNAQLLMQSFEKLVQRHDVFRTTFLYDNLEHPLQIVLSQRPIEFHIGKANVSDEQSKDEFIGNFLEKDREMGFNVTSDPLIRLALLQTEEKNWTLVVTFHHILMDGWCSDLVFHELFSIYTSLKKRVSIDLPAVQPYSGYIKWLEKQDKEYAGKYWREYLDGYEEVSGVPYVRKKEASSSYESRECSYSMGRELTGQLTEIAKQSQVTLSALFQTIWGIVLQKYNDRNDVVFGSVVTGRPATIAGVEQMIGLFINTLPVRVQTRENQTFYTLLQQTYEQMVESHEYAYFPLSRIQKESAGGGFSLFNHILVFDYHPVEKEWEEIAAGIGLQLGEQRVIEHTNYDLSVTATVYQNELTVKFIYNANAICEAEINRIFNHIINVAKHILEDISMPIRQISLLASEEIQSLLESNRTNTDYPKDQTIADLFEKQVEELPDQVALIFEGQTLTYDELNEKANVLAHLLQSKGIGPDQLVGLMTEKSFEMIIGIMGILKSGAAYVPMDPDNPVERLSMIMDDSKALIILVQRSVLPKLMKVMNHAERKETIEYYVVEDILLQSKPEWRVNPKRLCDSRHLGYVMYTSGSTGKPKGILTQQNSIIRVVRNTNYINITPEDTVLQISNFAFDGSVFDIFGSLLNGARLVLVRKDLVLEMSALLHIIEEQEITVFFTTTALFNTLVDLNIRSFAKVRKVLFGGERVSLMHVKKAFEYMGKGKILHMYGPTESTVYTTYHEVNDIDEILGTVPIGVPLANTKVLILNKEDQLQPPGVIGELCIAGDGLARGYLHNEALTAEKFIAHPMSAGERIYRTGDLARWLEDGTIEFVGRADHQVKLRGFRIELGEIEYRLLSCKGIKEAFVMDCQDPKGGRTLCAYYVALGNVTVDELRGSLSAGLPYYMIPSYFVRLEALPLNPNGKVEKTRLPLPEWSIGSTSAFEAPLDELEKQLTEVWQDVLGVDKVGVSDNYYELGGDSIKAIQICARLRDHDLNLSVSDLMRNPTIVDLKRCIHLLIPHKEQKLEDSACSGITDHALSELEEELKAAFKQR